MFGSRARGLGFGGCRVGGFGFRVLVFSGFGFVVWGLASRELKVLD